MSIDRPSTPPAASGLRTRAIAAWAFGAAAAASLNGLHSGFAYDDVAVIVDNPLIQEPTDPVTLLTAPYWRSENAGLLWRPLTLSAFALQRAIGGGDPMLFHLVNLLLAGVAAALVAVAARRVASPSVALGSGLLFATMPLHAEATGNIVGQAELWCLIAMLGAMLLWLRPSAERNGTGSRSLLLGLGVMAVAAKEQGFVLPAVLLALEWLRPGARRAWREIARDLLPLIVALALMLAARLLLLDGLGSGNPIRALERLSLGERAIVMLGLVPRLVLLFVWPSRLLADYNPGDVSVTPELGSAHALGALALAAIVGLALWSPKRLQVCILLICAALTFAPVANLAVISGVVLAERHLFIPSAFICLAAAAGMPTPRAPWVRTSLVIGVGVAVMLGLARNWTRHADWRSTETVVAALRRDAPSNYRGMLLWSRTLAARGETDSARALLEQALVQFDGDPRVYEELGQLVRQQSGCAAALPLLQRGLQLDTSLAVLRAKVSACTRGTPARIRASTE